MWNFLPFQSNHVLFSHHYRGIGVIGEQPVLLPRTSFEYSSACPLSTPNGRMVRLESFVLFSLEILPSHISCCRLNNSENKLLQLIGCGF